MVIAVPGFFAFAVGAGYLTDYLTDSKTITYITTPIGAVLGAFVAWGVTYLASLPFVNHFGNKLKKRESLAMIRFPKVTGGLVHKLQIPVSI